MQKISAEVISAEEQNFNKQMAEFTISIPFQYFLCTFWPNSILFQDLENRFHNSILFQYCVGTLLMA